MQVHSDAASGGEDRHCFGVDEHLYLADVPGSAARRCYSRTAEIAFDVAPALGRRMQDVQAGGRGRRSNAATRYTRGRAASSRLIPLNILSVDDNSAQLNIGDCLQMLAVSQQHTGFGEAAMRGFVDTLDPEVA
jgi:hypothetical protein